MNNDVYRTVDKSSEEAEAVQKTEETRLMIALGRVVRSRDWKIICEGFLAKRLASHREIADGAEGADLFRSQGAIGELKVLMNLQAVHTAQQNTNEYAKKETTE